MNKDILNFENPRKWTWYLFLFANVILIIGIGISFAITNTSSVLTYWFVPIIVCGIVSIVAASMCYYLETKELVLLKTHVPRECFFFFLLSGAIYTMALLFAFAMTGATQSITPHQPFTLSLALNFGITAFLSLISIGLYRYGKYRIEMAMYKRRRGEVLKKQEEIHKEKTELQNLTEQEIIIKREKQDDDYSSITTPTSNLVNNADKENESKTN